MNRTIAHVAIINSGKGVVGLVHKAIGMFRLSGAADILYFVYNSNVKYNKDVHVFFHIVTLETVLGRARVALFCREAGKKLMTVIC